MQNKPREFKIVPSKIEYVDDVYGIREVIGVEYKVLVPWGTKITEADQRRGIRVVEVMTTELISIKEPNVMKKEREGMV